MSAQVAPYNIDICCNRMYKFDYTRYSKGIHVYKHAVSAIDYKAVPICDFLCVSIILFPD